MKRELIKKSSSTSKTIFDNAGVENVSQSTRCRVPQGRAGHVKHDIRHPSELIRKEKRLNCASEYMKLVFKVVLFTDEATLDGPHGWSIVWVAYGSNRPIRVKRQQGGIECVYV